MKRSIILSIFFIALLSGACSKDESTPSAEEKFLAHLAGTWQVSTVTLDDVNVSEEFDGMAVTFNKDQTFTVANPVGSIWPANGMFDLQDATGSFFDLVRDDEVVISVDELTDSSLMLSFGFDSAPGRLKGLAGEYTFTFTK